MYNLGGVKTMIDPNRECVRTGAAGAQTRRSLGHHLWHPQNFDQSIFINFFYVQMIFLVDVIEEITILGKESLFNTCLFTFEQFFSQLNHQNVAVFSSYLLYSGIKL